MKLPYVSLAHFTTASNPTRVRLLILEFHSLDLNFSFGRVLRTLWYLEVGQTDLFMSYGKVAMHCSLYVAFVAQIRNVGIHLVRRSPKLGLLIVRSRKIAFWPFGSWAATANSIYEMDRGELPYLPRDWPGATLSLATCFIPSSVLTLPNLEDRPSLAQHGFTIPLYDRNLTTRGFAKPREPARLQALMNACLTL